MSAVQIPPFPLRPCSGQHGASSPRFTGLQASWVTQCWMPTSASRRSFCVSDGVILLRSLLVGQIVGTFNYRFNHCITTSGVAASSAIGCGRERVNRTRNTHTHMPFSTTDNGFHRVNSEQIVLPNCYLFLLGLQQLFWDRIAENFLHNDCNISCIRYILCLCEQHFPQLC